MSYPFSDQFKFDTGGFVDESQPQLSPMTGYPQWETIERGEQQQQHQIESPMDSTTPTGPTPIAFRSINLEMDDVPRNAMPCQTTATQIDNAPIILHHPHALHQRHHLQQHQQQQQQFQQQHQYQQQHQQSRHPSLEPFSAQNSRPGSSSQHRIVTTPNDTFRPQSTAPPTPNPAIESGASTPNTAGGHDTSRKTSGPIRSSGRVTRAQQQAPYYRPSPASTTASYLGLEVPHAGSSASSTPRIPQQAEQQPRKQSVRFTAAPGQIQTRAASRAAASSMMPSPVTQLGSPTSQLPDLAGPAPAQHQVEIGFSPMTRRPSRSHPTANQTQAPPQQRTSVYTHSPPQALPQQAPTPTHEASPSSQPQTQPQVQTQPPQASSAAFNSYLYARRRHPLSITSDMHYSQSSNILHVSLELPGVKKKDVHIKLATCYFNHVKFISVHAESAPVFDLPGAVESGIGKVDSGGDQGQDASSGTKKTQASTGINADLRERRFGLLKRVIQVPSTTKLEDIDAFMEDGVLSLKIYCGKPYELDDEQTILIR